MNFITDILFLDRTVRLTVLPGVPNHFPSLVNLKRCRNKFIRTTMSEYCKRNDVVCGFFLYLGSTPGSSILRVNTSALLVPGGLVAEGEETGLVQGRQTI